MLGAQAEVRLMFDKLDKDHSKYLEGGEIEVFDHPVVTVCRSSGGGCLGTSLLLE